MYILLKHVLTPEYVYGKTEQVRKGAYAGLGADSKAGQGSRPASWGIRSSKTLEWRKKCSNSSFKVGNANRRRTTSTISEMML